jgi:hypothetical protein
VIRDNNVGVDVLSKLGSDRANIPPGVFVHELHHSSIWAPDSSSIAQGPKKPDREVLTIEVDWRGPSSTTSRSINYPRDRPKKY